MKKVREARVDTHFDGDENKVCVGSRKWTSENIGHVLTTGTNVLSSEWSVKCPQCRKIVLASNLRSRLPIKEAFTQIKEMVMRKVK